jgi:hypothetical protein
MAAKMADEAVQTKTAMYTEVLLEISTAILTACTQRHHNNVSPESI